MRMKTEGEAMNNKCFKYLPDGSQSYLSLNAYIVSCARDYNKEVISMPIVIWLTK